MKKHILTFIALAAAVGLFLAAWPGKAGAQQPELKNLQHFPKDITRQQLVGRMRQFSFALGVPCTHCHGTEEQTGFDLSGVDFSLDIKPTKFKARQMLKMVDLINKELSESPAERSELNLKVTCFTCHHGIQLPEAIEQRVLRVASAQGVEAAIADYRELRQKNYGSAAYNFGEQPLVEAAFELHQQQDFRGAADLSELNLEFHPQSGQSLFRLGEAYAKLGEKEKARAAYNKLLEMNPNNARIKSRLEALDQQPD